MVDETDLFRNGLQERYYELILHKTLASMIAEEGSAANMEIFDELTPRVTQKNNIGIFWQNLMER